MVYVPAFDGIRAFAVLMVLMFHSGLPWMYSGYLGVDVFFVLSGFIITTLLLEEVRASGRINVVHFYIRRLFRLYPALLLMLVLVLAGFWAVFGILPGELNTFKRDAVLAALYLTDFSIVWGVTPRTSIVFHTWSLAIEEHYYILWPLALIFLRKRILGHGIARMIGAAFLAAVVWRFAGGILSPDSLIYCRFDMRVSGLLLGSWLAACRLEGGKIPEPAVLLCTLFPILVVLMPQNLLLSPLTFNIGVLVTELFTCCLISAIMQGRGERINKVLSSAVPVYLGRISYGIYLYHYPVAAFIKVKHYDWPESLAVTLVLSVAIASLSFFLIERPILARARKYRTERRIAHHEG